VADLALVVFFLLKAGLLRIGYWVRTRQLLVAGCCLYSGGLVVAQKKHWRQEEQLAN
jgi:hypothetical protein